MDEASSTRRDAGRAPPGAAACAPDAAQAMRILVLLRDDGLDAAIEAGLAAFVPLAELDAADNGALVETRDRLLAAWAARERHRQRGQRLERIARERRRARSAAPGETSDSDNTAPTNDDAAPGDAGTRTADAPAARPALPAAAAAALARARARAAGRQP